MTLRFDRFFNFVYSWFAARISDRAQFDAILAQPLPKQGSRALRPSPADLESEGSDFMNFMGQMTTAR